MRRAVSTYMRAARLSYLAGGFYFRISFSLATSVGSSFKISPTFCSRVAPSVGLISRFAFFASAKNRIFHRR